MTSLRITYRSNYCKNIYSRNLGTKNPIYQRQTYMFIRNLHGLLCNCAQSRETTTRLRQFYQKPIYFTWTYITVGIWYYYFNSIVHSDRILFCFIILDFCSIHVHVLEIIVSILQLTVVIYQRQRQLFDSTIDIVSTLISSHKRCTAYTFYLRVKPLKSYSKL